MPGSTADLEGHVGARLYETLFDDGLSTEMAQALLTELDYAADAVHMPDADENTRMGFYKGLPDFLDTCDIIMDSAKKGDFRYGNVIMTRAQQLKDRLYRIKLRSPYC